MKWSFIKRQTRGRTSDNEWQRVVQRMKTSGTTSDNEWQRMTTSDSKWQWMTASDNKWHNEWQQMTMIDSEWQKVVQRVKKTHLLQRMDDCNSFYNENRYTTSRDGWLILEWLNRLPLKGWLQPLRSVSLIYGSLQALVKKWHYHRKNRW